MFVFSDPELDSPRAAAGALLARSLARHTCDEGKKIKGLIYESTIKSVDLMIRVLSDGDRSLSRRLDGFLFRFVLSLAFAMLLLVFHVLDIFVCVCICVNALNLEAGKGSRAMVSGCKIRRVAEK